MQLRGFRSRPGAPMHDPNTNRPMSRDNMTPQSSWDRAFRDTASNNFGETQNPLYVSSFGGTQDPFDISSDEPTPVPSPDTEEDEIPTMEQLANGGVASHQEEWSKPRPSRGWDYTGKAEQESIFDRYKSKNAAGDYAAPGAMSIGSRGRKQFGWASAFES